VKEYKTKQSGQKKHKFRDYNEPKQRKKPKSKKKPLTKTTKGFG